MKNYLLAFAAAAAFVLAGSGQAQAVPLLSCPAGQDCNGATVGAELVSLGGSQYRIDVWFNFNGYNGAQTDLLHAVGIKDFTAGTVTSPSVSVFGQNSANLASWGLSTEELNANGCGGGSGGDRLCTEATPATAGVQVHNGSNYLLAIYSFTFNTTGPLAASTHLKFLYIDPTQPLDAQGDAAKVGSLGSFNVDFSTCAVGCTPDPRDVPEPATLALLGAGLIAAGIARRRK